MLYLTGQGPEDPGKPRKYALFRIKLAEKGRHEHARARAAARPVQDQKPPFHYVWGKAAHVLPETTSEESGYFSLCEGIDGEIYVGTAKYGDNAYLVEFDPRTGKQRIVLDNNEVCGLSAKGYAAQSKIHTRNFVAPSGRIYVGSSRATGRRTTPPSIPAAMSWSTTPPPGSPRTSACPSGPGRDRRRRRRDARTGLRRDVRGPALDDPRPEDAEVSRTRPDAHALRVRRCSTPRAARTRHEGLQARAVFDPPPGRRPSRTSSSTERSGRARTTAPSRAGSSPRTGARPISS